MLLYYYDSYHLIISILLCCFNIIQGIHDIGYQVCNHTIPHGNYTPHSFTERGLDDLEYIFKSQRMDLHKYLSSHSHGMILDFGCGSGHAILEIQEKFPDMKTYCVNKGGYGKSQSENSQDLIDAAYYFKIKLNCKINTDDIILPHIDLTPGLVQDQMLNHNYHGKFDFIYSMHALNQGKLEITQSHIWLDKLIPLLKYSLTSRMILILNKFDFNVIYGASNDNSSNNQTNNNNNNQTNNNINYSNNNNNNNTYVEKRNHKIHTWQYYEHNAYIYITLYIVILRGNNESFFGVSVLKCKYAFCKINASHSLVHAIESDSTDTINIIRKLKITKYGTRMINNYKNLEEILNGNLYNDRYSIEYMWNLLENLDMKEKMFAVPVPSQPVN